jgi:hypothetical protein
MAVTKITPVKLKLNEFSAALTFTAPTAAADGFAVEFKEQDVKTVILVQNSGSAAYTVKIVQGDGIQGVVDTDTVSLAAGAIVAVNVEAGAYKQLSGDNKGCVVLIPSNVAVKAAAVVTP